MTTIIRSRRPQHLAHRDPRQCGLAPLGPARRHRQVLHGVGRRPRAGTRRIFKDRLPEEYHDRLPSVVTKRDGEQEQRTEGFRPTRLNWVEPLQGHEKLRYESGRRPDGRVAELALDGVDAEILFPNVGLAMWATRDPAFSHRMCVAWNDWAWEHYGPFNEQLAPWPASLPPCSTTPSPRSNAAPPSGSRASACPASPSSAPPTWTTSTTTSKTSNPYGPASRRWGCR